MQQTLIDRYDIPVPRYTSYPTAPHFHAGVNAARYVDWLRDVPADIPLSLYAHIPFCRSLCWFCGCHMQVVNRPEPVEAYLEALRAEIESVARLLGPGRKVRHIHFGGGSPTIMSPAQIRAILKLYRNLFDVQPDAEIAIEIDPRRMNDERIAVLGECGFTRASLGVQDVAEDVQRAVNRLQPMEHVHQLAKKLRQAGVGGLNVDLMYGLPHQTVQHVLGSVDSVAEMAPDRLALFGYAHVPHMKAHQKLIPESALPGATERFAQAEAAAERLCGHGYDPIGLDHFARRDDPLAVAARNGALHRNFQGYTTDLADMLIGFGASAIGSGPMGYVQNEPNVRLYMERAAKSGLAVARGRELDEDDRLRATLIETLMCAMQVDVAAICQSFGRTPETLGIDLTRLDTLQADGLVQVDGWHWRVPEDKRLFLRIPCALFDGYLGQGSARHARAV